MKSFFLVILILFFTFHITAQEIDDLFNKDLDSLFDETFTSEDGTVSQPAADSSPVNVNRTGIIFGASYEFQGVLAPGWNLAPWHFDGTEERTWGQGVKMVSNLSINAQLSEVFKVFTSIGFNIPGFSFTLGNFFLDYNFFNKVFIRAGKYEHTWGISEFTNLLARVPDAGPWGPAYIAKADIPIGVGGFQALILTRVDIAGGTMPEHWEDLALGGKYNIALRWLDLNLGVFFQRYVMPTRGFLSVKTTLGKTELYSEWLVAVNTHTDNAASFAANIGLGRGFFNNKLTLGGEVFYNGEGNTYFFKPETSLTDEETVQFFDQFTFKFNLLYRINWKGSPRIFSSIKYSTAEDSFQIVPGFKFTPFNNIEVYLAVPMELGRKEVYYKKDGYYNDDPYNRPFSVILLVTLTGNVFVSSFN